MVCCWCELIQVAGVCGQRVRSGSANLLERAINKRKPSSACDHADSTPLMNGELHVWDGRIALFIPPKCNQISVIRVVDVGWENCTCVAPLYPQNATR